MVRETKIPKTLDNPGRIAGVPRDSLLLGVGIFALFYVFDATWTGIGVGALTAFLYSRYRKKTLLRRMARTLYWFLPAGINPIKKGAKGYQRNLTIKESQNGKEI